MTEPFATLPPRKTRWVLAIYWLVLIVATHWPSLVIESPIPKLPFDKLMHFVAFGILAALLRLALPPHRRTIALIVSIGYVFFDEYTQEWFHRVLDMGDIIAGLIGVAFATAVFWPSSQPSHQKSQDDRGFVGHAILVAVLTFGSRITGLVRDAVLFAFLGLSSVADAFFIGFMVPNLFRRLFGEGALAAAFIPHYTELLKKDEQLARRFAMLCLTGLVIVTLTLTLIGEAVLAAWLHLGDLNDKTQLAIQLTMAMLPYMPMVCVVALLGGVLQVHKRFGPPAAAPVLLNIVMIGFVAWGVHLRHDDPSLVWMLAMAVLAAGLLQLIWQAVVMCRCAGLSLGYRGTGKSVRSMLVMMLPMLIGLAVFQINTLFDSLIAFGLSTTEPFAKLSLFGFSLDYPIQNGAVAALVGGQRLYQFPLGVFGIALATAIFPALAHAAVDRDSDSPDPDAFARMLRQGLRLSMFIGLPASAGLILLREPIVQLFFQRGAFGYLETQRTAVILAGYAAGVWAYSMTHVLTRAFYAQKNAHTPLRISLAMVTVNLMMNLILIWPLGAVGLAISSAISGTGQALLLRIMIERHGTKVVDGSVLRSWTRTIILTAVMCLAVWPIAHWTQTSSTLAVIGVVSLGVAIGASVIAVGSYFTGAEELRWLIRRRL